MNRRLRYLLAVVFLGLFALLLWMGDPGRIGRLLTETDPGWYTVAAGLFGSTYLLIALRWQTLQSASGISLSLRTSFEVTALSYGFNKLLPANSGDLVRSKITDDYVAVDRHGDVLAMVVVERLADVLSICLVLLAGSVFSTAVSRSLEFAAGAIAVSILLVGFGSVRLDRFPLADWLPGRVRGEFKNGVTAARTLSGPTTVHVLLLSVLRWLLLAGAFVAVGRSLGVRISLSTGAIVTTSMSLAAVLPLSPGGVGPVDAVGTTALVLSRTPYDVALALVVLQRTLGLGLMSLVGIAVYCYRLVRPPVRAGERDNG